MSLQRKVFSLKSHDPHSIMNHRWGPGARHPSGHDDNTTDEEIDRTRDVDAGHGAAFVDGQPPEELDDTPDINLHVPEMSNLVSALREECRGFSSTCDPRMLKGMGTVLQMEVARMQSNFHNQVQQMVGNMSKTIAEQMKAQLEGSQAGNGASDPQSSRSRKTRRRQKRCQSESENSSDGDVPVEDRQRIHLDDLRVPNGVEVTLVNQTIHKIMNLHAVAHWTWGKMSPVEKQKLILRVRKGFRNGNRISEAFLRDKITSVLRNGRYYLRANLRRQLLKEWDGRNHSKLTFDCSIPQEQVDLFLSEEKSMAAYLKRRDAEENLADLPLDADDTERRRLEVERHKWATIYEECGHLSGQRTRALERNEFITHRSRYGQGGQLQFISNFEQIFKRKPTNEEDEYAKLHGPCKLHNRIFKEEEKHAEAQKASANLQSTRNGGQSSSSLALGGSTTLAQPASSADPSALARPPPFHPSHSEELGDFRDSSDPSDFEQPQHDQRKQKKKVKEPARKKNRLRHKVFTPLADVSRSTASINLSGGSGAPATRSVTTATHPAVNIMGGRGRGHGISKRSQSHSTLHGPAITTPAQVLSLIRDPSVGTNSQSFGTMPYSSRVSNIDRAILGSTQDRNGGDTEDVGGDPTLQHQLDAPPLNQHFVTKYRRRSKDNAPAKKIGV